MHSDELSYELMTRGFESGGTVSEKRTLLRQALQMEINGSLNCPPYSLNPVQELEVCSVKLQELHGSIEEFDVNNLDNDYVRIKSRLLHVQRRLHRVLPSNNALVLKKNNLLLFCDGLFEALEDALNIARLGQPQAAHTSILDEPNLLVPQVVNRSSIQADSTAIGNLIDLVDNPAEAQSLRTQPSNPVDQIARRLSGLHFPGSAGLSGSQSCAQTRRVSFPSSSLYSDNRPMIQSVHTETAHNNWGSASIPSVDRNMYQPDNAFRTSDPIWKWNLSFDGQGSVVSFLENLEEKAEARHTPRSQLFQAASEFLKGDALLWYRPRKSTFYDWDDFKMKLREAFTPFDYEANLLDDIRKRTQGPDEKLVLFVSKMQGMFRKLARPPSEEEQVHLIRRNLLPYIHTALALQKVSTVDELLKIGRVVEESHWRAKQYCPPSSGSTMQEPSLEYRQVRIPKPQTHRTHFVHASGIQDPAQQNIHPATGNQNQRQGLVCCWGCKKPGHILSACPDISCFRCGLKGYTIRTCPTCSKNAYGGRQ